MKKLSKKQLIIVIVAAALAVAVALTVTLCICLRTFTVTFDSNGGSAVAAYEKIKNKSTITAPANPTYANHAFDGWHKDKELTTPWNFETDVVTGNITLYAKWTEATDGLVYTLNDDGTSYRVSAESQITAPNTVLIIPAMHEGLWVTSVEARTLYENSAIAEVILPASIKEIGDYAFGDCPNLSKITFAQGVEKIGKYVFNGNAVTQLVLPDGVKEIGDYSFSNCSLLADITLPSSVKKVGSYVFSNCASDKAVKYNGTLEQWCAIDFGETDALLGKNLTINGTVIQGEISIPTTVAQIKDNTFSGFDKITAITLPPSVLKIGANAFGDCTALQKVKAEGDLVIDKRAFQNCVELAEVTFDKNVQAVGSYAFYNCRKLTAMPDFNEVRTFGDYVFCDCVSLGEATFPVTVTVIGEGLFAGCTELKKADFSLSTRLENIGGRAFYGCEKLANVTLPEKLSAVSNETFYGCKVLTSVSLPDTVTSIGDGAFSGCNALQSLPKINNVTKIGESAFENCWNITDALLKDSALIELGAGAFAYCSKLANVTLPAKLAAINDYVFAGCGFADIELPVGITEIGANAFNGCIALTGIVIPEGVKTVRRAAFNSCTKLTEVTLPSTLTSIGMEAFKSCQLLSSVNIPSGVTSIGVSAFNACVGLTAVTLPAALTDLGNFAFQGCSGISAVTIPQGVKNIGMGVFSNCTALTSLTVENGNTAYVAQGNCLIDVASKTLIAGCSASVIPQDQGIVVIADYAFDGSAFSSVTVPQTVTKIGRNAFRNCKGLTEVVIPDGVTEIGDHAFDACSALASVTIGKGVTSIGRGAFTNCALLSAVTFDGLAELDGKQWAVGDSTPDANGNPISVLHRFTVEELNGNDVYLLFTLTYKDSDWFLVDAR